MSFRRCWVTFPEWRFEIPANTRHSRPAFQLSDTVVPMQVRFAPLVPLALAFLLTACAGNAPHQQPFVERMPQATSLIDEPSQEEPADLTHIVPYRLPALADAVLERGFGLLGTPYRFGGVSEQSGFDCSGFIGYVFREELGLELPRSTRDMISMDAPRVARSDLAPGDLVFFNNRGRGRVSHAGIYIGNGRFLHSSSRRSGGVRVDSLNDGYWNASYLQAKRVLSLAEMDVKASR